MKSSHLPEDARVASYFDAHAQDFDQIYETEKSPLRRLRDQLTRGTVVRRLDFVNQIADDHKPTRVLDVGCGSGRFGISLAKRGVKSVGLDFAGDMVTLAQRAAAEAGVSDLCTFLQGDFLTWDADGQFDLALAIGVFDYVAEPGPLLAKLAAVSGGQVVVSFPRLFHPLVPLRFVRLRANGCPVHFYRRAQVEQLARQHLPSFEVISMQRDYLVVGRR